MVAESEFVSGYSLSRKNLAVLPVSGFPGPQISFLSFVKRLWGISKIWKHSKLNSAHFRKRISSMLYFFIHFIISTVYETHLDISIKELESVIFWIIIFHLIRMILMYWHSFCCHSTRGSLYLIEKLISYIRWKDILK